MQEMTFGDLNFGDTFRHRGKVFIKVARTAGTRIEDHQSLMFFKESRVELVERNLEKNPLYRPLSPMDWRRDCR